MRLRHKPIEVEGDKYVPGMEDGVLAYCIGAHKQIFFDSLKAMRDSPHFGKVKTHVPAKLVGNVPIPIDDGDWIIEGQVVTAKEFDKNWERIQRRPRKNEERTTDKG